MTFPDAIRSLVATYKHLLAHANGATASVDSDKVSSSPTPQRPRDFGSEAEELAARVIRLAKVADVQLRAALGGRFNEASDRHHPLRAATKTVILEEHGKPAVELAFLYGVHQSTVERIRRDAGRDPQFGEPRAEVPFTEPPSDTLRRRHRERSES